MHFIDEAILISKFKYGETSLVLNFFTKNHGLQKGLFKGGTSKKNKAMLEIGSILQIEKRTRTEEHLGLVKVEPVASYLLGILHNPIKVIMLSCICQIVETLIFEKDPHSYFYDTTKAFIEEISYEDCNLTMLKHYIKWEVILLQEIGFGLDLSKCVVSGEVNNLYYISPNTGKAVIKAVGQPYKDKLFVIPSFLKEENLTFKALNIQATNTEESKIVNNKQQNIDEENNKQIEGEIAESFKITSYFLHRFASEYGIKLPNIRDYLVAKVITTS